MMGFAERLKKLRSEKGVTQEKLARDLGVPESTVRRWETNKGMPKNERLPSIADYFGVSVDYLMGRSNDRQKKEYYFKSLNEQEMIIKEMVERYNIDLTRPGTKEKLERLIQIVFDDDEKSDDK